MLKENRNIDDSYTDRVIKQLAKETQIDFKSGKVNLPLANYSWPFNHFGPGGLENALAIRKSSNFAKHIVNNYGVDDEEFKEILAMYIGVIAGRIQDGLERENSPWLQEQIGYEDDAPNEVERQARYATQVVDWMVKETKIDDSHEDPSQWNIYAPHMGRWISPLGFISPNHRHWSAFENHMMDIYGLDWELVGTAWNNYLKEVTTTFRLLAGKAQGDDTPPWDMQYDYLVESTEDNFLGTIVSQLVDETEIGFEYGMPHISAFPDPGFSIDTSFNLNVDLWENLFGDMFKSFWTHCREVYGLTDAEIQKVWWAYKTEVLKKIEFNRWVINESTEDNFLGGVLQHLVDETMIEYGEYEARGIPMAYPSWVIEDNEGVDLAVLLDSGYEHWNFKEFSDYVKNMYGLSEGETKNIWEPYLDGIDKKFSLYIAQNNLNHPWRINESKEDLNVKVHKAVDELWNKDKKLKDVDTIKKYFEDKGLDKQDADEAMVQYLSKQQSLNESSDDLNSYVHTVVDTMVDNTHLIYEKQTNTIMAKLPFYIIDMGFKEGHIDTIGQSYLVHPTARIVAEIRKHLILIYGMDKWESDAAALMYLSKMTDKINDYKREGLNESVIGKNDDEVIGKEFWFEYHCWESPESCDAEAWYRSHQKVIVIGRGEDDHDQYPSEVKVYKIRFEDGLEYDVFEDELLDSPEEFYRPAPPLHESVDLSYSDDKDFPFLNKLANHTMSVTEIGRNAVMFPFIEGYISDGNFHKYFHGTPYDQLPFEATLKLDEYLKDFGLTENEKEIWWDIYVIKVIDAINERDLRIIDNYGELNESTEDIYEKIVNSMLRESDIVEQKGKLFLRSPAFDGGVNVEIVLDIMSGRTKRAIPNPFIKHMKEIYNIEEKGYNTVLETVWALYRDKMIERIKIKQAQLRQISPKQRKFFDHILKTLVDGTEIETMKVVGDDNETYEQRVWISPPFLNHRVDAARDREVSVEWNEFSYFGYGYPSYMKDIYGLTDQEGLKLWAPYYKALQKKVEELIERDRIIYGDY